MMTRKCRSAWLIALSILCLAFDPVDPDVSDNIRNETLGSLLKIESALLGSGISRVLEYKVGADASHPFGPDPFRIAYLRPYERYLLLLRSASKILLCDKKFDIIDSRAAPRGAVSWDLSADNILFVGGELSGTIRTYNIGPGNIEPLTDIDLINVPSVRDLVYIAEYKSVFMLDDFNRKLVRAVLPAGWEKKGRVQIKQDNYPLGAGPHSILIIGDHLIINLLLDHKLLILPFVGGVPNFDDATSISNAGPIWGLAATAKNGRLLIAAGGIENHPFSRESGEFGYLDSFLYLFTLEQNEKGLFRWVESDRQVPTRFQAVNLSEHGVLTPKALVFDEHENGLLKLLVTGYGGERALAFAVNSDGLKVEREYDVIPGISDVVVVSDSKDPFMAVVSPLLDRATELNLATGDQKGVWAYGETDLPSHIRTRMGEILFYTDLMSPNNTTAGELSKFTCEACHFEGLIDGRVHFTGRGKIHATTKPLPGLGHNVPLFSRAGDESLSSMVMAEFLVANQNRRGNFLIVKNEHPWISTLISDARTISPLELRESLLSFFAAFQLKPNPWRLYRGELDDSARRGLLVFREKCVDCHQAIISTRTEKGVPFSDWESWLTEAYRDLIWGAPFMSRTGIRPYVDPAGARVPSLRRVWMKYPLFTNGSSPTIRDVLTRFRYQGTTVWHHLEDDAAVSDSGVLPLTQKEKFDLEMLLRYF